MNVDQEKLKQVVLETLELDEEYFSSDLKLGSNPSWDSLSHINLVFAIEEAFDVRFETDEIPKIQSISLIIEALEKR